MLLFAIDRIVLQHTCVNNRSPRVFDIRFCRCSPKIALHDLPTELSPPIAPEREDCRLIKYECCNQRLPSLIANTKYKIQTAPCEECGVRSSLCKKRKPGKSVRSGICCQPVNNYKSSFYFFCGKKVKKSHPKTIYSTFSGTP